MNSAWNPAHRPDSAPKKVALPMQQLESTRIELEESTDSSPFSPADTGVYNQRLSDDNTSAETAYIRDAEPSIPTEKTIDGLDVAILSDDPHSAPCDRDTVAEESRCPSPSHGIFETSLDSTAACSHQMPRYEEDSSGPLNKISASPHEICSNSHIVASNGMSSVLQPNVFQPDTPPTPVSHTPKHIPLEEDEISHHRRIATNLSEPITIMNTPKNLSAPSTMPEELSQDLASHSNHKTSPRANDNLWNETGPKAFIQQASVNNASIPFLDNAEPFDEDYAFFEQRTGIETFGPSIATSSAGFATDIEHALQESHSQSALQEESNKSMTSERLFDGAVDTISAESNVSDAWAAVLDEDFLLGDEAPLDASAFFIDDDDGFLEDEDPPSFNTEHNTNGRSLSQINTGNIDTQNLSHGPANDYVPPSPGSRNQASSYLPHSTTLAHSAPMHNAYHAQLPPSHIIPQPSGPNLGETPQSFADKSRGGYVSPYDLPIDLTQTRKRAPLARASTAQHVLTPQIPPPRGFSAQGYSVQGHPSFQSDAEILAAPGPQIAGNTAPHTNKAVTNFFEELPATRPRSVNSSNQVIVSQLPIAPPPPPIGMSPNLANSQDRLSNNIAPQHNSPQSLPSNAPSFVYDKTPQQAAPRPSSTINSRYQPAQNLATVPAPQSSPNTNSHTSRYAAPSTGSIRPPSISVLAHQPRTSSPLAQSSSTFPMEPQRATDHNEQYRHPIANNMVENFPTTHHLGSRYGAETQSGPSSNINSAYGHLSSATTTTQPQIPQRYASAPVMLPSSLISPQQIQSGTMHINNDSGPMNSILEHSRNIVQHTAVPANNFRPSQAISGPSLESSRAPEYMNLIIPTDGRETDPLERWKGRPIFTIGFGGVVTKMFPKRIPKYAVGRKAPQFKCEPGDVKIEAAALVELDPSIVTFPGPLRSKNKKKDVIEWLQRRMQLLESELPQDLSDAVEVKRQAERLLLWKVLHLLVESDGSLDGQSTIKKLRELLILGSGSTPGLNILGISDTVPIIPKTSAVSEPGLAHICQAIDGVRNLLLKGEREKAVWHAVDNKIWDHAMLIASTLSKEVWRQVIQEFIKQGMRPLAENTDPLSAIYQIFAGNHEESVDELVPPSARAGLQMVNKLSSVEVTRNAFEGLEKWRETAALILSNRTHDDGKAFLALGDMLARYGRVEASHVCFLFARNPDVFGGVEDPKAKISLLGTDLKSHPFHSAQDIDNILLTEIYDFIQTSLVSSSAITISPHLQAFRLLHASHLAEHGLKVEAQQYCDAILSTLKSTTKPSSYYHGALFLSLENLQDRLRQAPSDPSASWISKPKLDKVSGSIWAKFNSYVAGEEDATGVRSASNAHDIANGPFANVAGESSDLNVQNSSTDSCPDYTSFSAQVPITNAPSTALRYTPSGFHTNQIPMIKSTIPPNEALEITHGPSQRYSPHPNLSRSEQFHEGAPQRAASPSTRSYSPVPTMQRQPLPEQFLSSEHQPSSQPHGLGLYDKPQFSQYHTPERVDSSFNESSAIFQAQYGEPNIHLANYHQADSRTFHDNDDNAINTGEFSNRIELAPATSQHDTSYRSHERLDAPVNNLDSAGFPASTYASPLMQPAYDDPKNESVEYGNSSYEPPSYEPPSYEPPVLDETHDYGADQSSPKNDRKLRGRGVMDLDNDDDDEYERRAAAMRKAEKARKDKEADEAFRSAAEADAAKDGKGTMNGKKSWFGGGWFGRGDAPEEKAGSLNGKPVQVKLGEEKSAFYFDENLKKWVNSKDPASETGASAAPPPPPKSLPSRTASAMGGGSVGQIPHSMSLDPARPQVPSKDIVNSSIPPAFARAFSMPAHALPIRPESAGPMGPLGKMSRHTDNDLQGDLPPLAPPSRPATSQGMLSGGGAGGGGIDDLLGLPARRAGTMKKVKKGRGYVDVLGKP